MEQVLMTRVDASRNMARFYALAVEPGLFGMVLVRDWGRIGSVGRRRVEMFDTAEDAERALEKLARRKIRRGYHPG